MIKLKTPFEEKEIRKLRMGDTVSITGKIFTGRDKISKYFYDGNEPPCSLANYAFYHCGPIIIKESGQWKVIAAGPTTSSRLEPYQWKLIEELGIRAVIGKGGMGDKTAEACKKYGCVYLHAIGGAARLIAQKIKQVSNVYFLDEFGSTEAMWEMEVEDLPAVVTIDSNGNSLHKEIKELSEKNLEKLLK